MWYTAGVGWSRDVHGEGLEYSTRLVLEVDMEILMIPQESVLNYNIAHSALSTWLILPW